MTDKAGELAEPSGSDSGMVATDEHFKPTGTIFILGIFVVVMILLWLSVYAILIARGVTG